MISQQLYATSTFAAWKSGFLVTGERQCVILHPTALGVLKQTSLNTTAEESVCPVGPEDFQPEEAARCCAYRTSASACMGEKTHP
jgi:hypothetical protein